MVIKAAYEVDFEVDWIVLNRLSIVVHFLRCGWVVGFEVDLEVGLEADWIICNGRVLFSCWREAIGE